MNKGYTIKWEFYITSLVVSLITGFITIFVFMGGHLYLPWGYALFCLPGGMIAGIFGETENKFLKTIFNSIIFSVAIMILISALMIY